MVCVRVWVRARARLVEWKESRLLGDENCGGVAGRREAELEAAGRWQGRGALILGCCVCQV